MRKAAYESEIISGEDVPREASRWGDQSDMRFNTSSRTISEGADGEVIHIGSSVHGEVVFRDSDPRIVEKTSNTSGENNC